MVSDCWCIIQRYNRRQKQKACQRAYPDFIIYGPKRISFRNWTKKETFNTLGAIHLTHKSGGARNNLTASHLGPAYPSAINQKGFKYRMLAVRTRNIGDFIGIKQQNVKEIVLIVASLRTFWWVHHICIVFFSKWRVESRVRLFFKNSHNFPSDLQKNGMQKITIPSLPGLRSAIPPTHLSSQSKLHSCQL